MSLPSSVFRSPSSVHVWWIDLSVTGNGDDVLSPEEGRRAARLRQQRDRARWVAARSVLRQILARYTGSPPRELRLEAGPHGKPELAGGSPFRFSLSHAADRAVLAVTRQREIGVDLEARDPPLPDEDLHRLIRTICTTDEARELDALPPADRREAFLRHWTLKEAYLKGLGVGLMRDPRDVRLHVDDDGRATLHDVQEDSWTLRLLDAGPEWVAALAVAGTALEVVEFDWPPVGKALTRPWRHPERSEGSRHNANEWDPQGGVSLRSP